MEIHKVEPTLKLLGWSHVRSEALESRSAEYHGASWPFTDGAVSGVNGHVVRAKYIQ
jgi:hypothetical protein